MGYQNAMKSMMNTIYAAIKVKEDQQSMVLCIKLTLMVSRVITLSQENIPYNDFVSDWKILSPDELKSGGYKNLREMFNNLNFALLETGKRPSSLTEEDLRKIIDTATQKYSLWLRDPTSGMPGLNQPVCW